MLTLKFPLASVVALRRSVPLPKKMATQLSKAALPLMIPAVGVGVLDVDVAPAAGVMPVTGVADMVSVVAIPAADDAVGVAPGGKVAVVTPFVVPAIVRLPVA